MERRDDTGVIAQRLFLRHLIVLSEVGRVTQNLQPACANLSTTAGSFPPKTPRPEASETMFDLRLSRADHSRHYSITSAEEWGWEVRFEDPLTWERSWAYRMPLKRDSEQMVIEYACHEGNRGLENILRAARMEEAAAKK